MSHWLQRIGQSDGDTFVSLIAKLGNNTTAFWAAIGYQGATSLADKLTAARAALIDQITALRMAELDPANIPADIDTLLVRLSALRAGYLDELAAANIPADVDSLLGDVGDASASTLGSIYAILGNPAQTFLAMVGYEGATALASKLTAARAALLDQITALRMAELDAANLPADIDALLARLTAARGGYMDFMPRVLAVSVTAAANAGVTIVATVATQPVVIDSIVLHADAAQTGDLTSAAVKGGVGQVVTFISAVEAAAANLNAADKQVGWAGVARLAVGKTIVVDLQGTGATAVDLTITITYHSEVAGGALS